jgi:hypothetical protein
MLGVRPIWFKAARIVARSRARSGSMNPSRTSDLILRRSTSITNLRGGSRSALSPRPVSGTATAARCAVEACTLVERRS